MKNIIRALAEFQQKVPVIHQGTTGHNYTYADLGTIITTIKPYLDSCKLMWFQRFEGNGVLKTTIAHTESGETIDSTIEIPNVELRGMNPYQAFGSGITYYRRYSLATALGLITDKDADASGEYDNGIKDNGIDPTSYGEALIKQLSQRIKAMHLELERKGDAPTFEELKEVGEGEAIKEFNFYKADLLAFNGKKWIDSQITMPKKSGSVDALRELVKEAKTRGFYTEYVEKKILEKKAELENV